MYLIGGHYRQPLAFSPSELRTPTDVSTASAMPCAVWSPAGRARLTWPLTVEAFFDALANDFNTPTALASLFEWVREANRRGTGWETRPARDARGPRSGGS